MISIAGCSELARKAGSSPAAVAAARCPPLKAYPAARQKAAAAELRALPPGSALADLVSDYGSLRARCRAYERR